MGSGSSHSGATATAFATECLKTLLADHSFAPKYSGGVDAITPDGPGLTGTVVLQQRWSDLVFLHWRADPAEISPLLPAGITPDQFDGSTWVGLIPFRMSRTRIAGRMPVPYFGDFIEVNVRLYGVDSEGRRGVVFLSLEASRLAAVLGARVAFNLPYMWASASASRSGDRVDFRSRRIGPNRPTTEISVRVTTDVVEGDELADFLTARFWLFETRWGKTIAMPNDHVRWPLVRAEIVTLRDELIAASGISSIGDRMPESVLFSTGVTTYFGTPVELTRQVR